MEVTARRFVVVGSLNVDLVTQVRQFPKPGETVLAGGELATLSGGKGANQALAAARLGANTALVGRVGDDAYGRHLLECLQRDRVACSGVGTTPGCSSGVAVIVVDQAGRNTIIVAPGASARLSTDDLDRHLSRLVPGNVVALQLEIPLPAVAHAAALARARGALVVLNPSPAQRLGDTLLASVDMFVLNETEASLLTGQPVDTIAQAGSAAAALRKRGAPCVLVTRGAGGVVAAQATGIHHFPARTVAAIDTTAAGETFIGGLCAGLLEGLELPEAIELGQAAAAVQVTRPGAQAAMPFRRELDESGIGGRAAG